jgi:hypothetical protein
MLIIIFIFFSFITGVSGFVIYMIYLPIRNKLLKIGKLSLKLNKKINIIYGFLLFIMSIYFTFKSFFPSESFYKDEFKKVTSIELPKSAEFVSKKASYPGFQGDYCSSSQIRLSKKDYFKLLRDLNNDNRFIKNRKIICFSEFYDVLDDKLKVNFRVTFTRKNNGKETYFFIAFYNDNETIFVNVCEI